MRGYIRKRGRGYRVEIHIGYDANGKRLRHMKTLSNKKAAEKYLRQKLDELETEGAVRSKQGDSDIPEFRSSCEYRPLNNLDDSEKR